MLLEIKVSNFAIIDNIHIQFKPGLNILSGETGAGKSVLLKSLALLMGGKASSEQIRTGNTTASIEGFFDISHRSDIAETLSALGIEHEDDLLIVRRVISQGDKSRVYLNGTLSTLANLREIVAPLIEVAGHSAPLIEMTGQHENRHLLSKAYHLDLLDQYCGTWDQRIAFESKYNRLTDVREQIAELENESARIAQRLDFLIFQRDEISALNLQSGEDQTLEIEVKKLKNTSRLSHLVDQAESALYSDDDSAVSRIDVVMQRSNELQSIDPTLSQRLEGLSQARTLIEDYVYDLRTYVNKIDADPAKLEDLESRLSDLRKLQKKYGPTADDIIQAHQKIEAEIHKLENSESTLESLRAEEVKLSKELYQNGLELHKRRQSGAKLLAAGVNDELLDLNMKGVTFEVNTQQLSELQSTGLSDIEFMTKTSAKDPARALSKYASGGELSRILLSLKQVVGSGNQPRTYLFDEVDTGVSGETAEKVGKKLKAIAKGKNRENQVICVTHLPQVAACGDAHFFIQKSPQKGAVAMEVIELSQRDRVKEIARLISGEKITKTSIAHAEELLGL